VTRPDFVRNLDRGGSQATPEITTIIRNVPAVSGLCPPPIRNGDRSPSVCRVILGGKIIETGTVSYRLPHQNQMSAASAN
jgi:hypothetical protein